MFISVSGLDGAGKSTQINLLASRLQNDGAKVRVIWARGGYTPGFEFLKKCIRLIFKKNLPKSGQSEERHTLINNPKVRVFWFIISIIDLIILWGVYARVLRAFGFIVIFDRYFKDTLLDFRYNFPQSDIEHGFLWKCLIGVCPKPDVSLLFLVPVKTSIERSLFKKEPFPDDKETLKWRLAAYMSKDDFPDEQNFRINGELDINTIADDVYAKILMRRSKEGVNH
jgi:thymidylate kinase